MKSDKLSVRYSKPGAEGCCNTSRETGQGFSLAIPFLTTCFIN